MAMKKTREKVCPVCGKSFETMNRTQKYCCAACSRKAQRKKSVSIPESRQCTICGQTFLPKRGGREKFCSEACQRRDAYLRGYVARFGGNIDDETAARLFDVLLHAPLKTRCLNCGGSVPQGYRLPLCSHDCAREFLKAVAEGDEIVWSEDDDEIPVPSHVCSGWLDAQNHRHPCPDHRHTAQHRCAACWQRTRVAHDCNVGVESGGVYDGYC